VDPWGQATALARVVHRCLSMPLLRSRAPTAWPPRLSVVIAIAALCAEAHAGRSPEAQRIIDQWVTRLQSRPIHQGEYATEGPALRDFHVDAQRYAGLAGRCADPEVTLLKAVFRVRKQLTAATHASALGTFDLNLAVLTDDLYLRPALKGSRLSPTGRRTVATIRTIAGRASVKTYEELGFAPKAPAATRRQPWAFRLGGSMPGALGEALRTIQPHDLGVAGFPSIVERWARSPELRGMLTQFSGKVADLRRRLQRGQPGASVYDLALACTGNNHRLAAEMLGAIVGQTKRPLRHVENVVLPRHPDAVGAPAAFADAARTYYLLGEIHELSVKRLGRSLLYPPDAPADQGPKFWHFYAAEALSLNLLERGYRPRAVRDGGALIAAAYEVTSIPKNLRLEPRGGPAALLKHVKDSAGDVRRQVLGNRFGREQFVAAGKARHPSSSGAVR
jgi:hypothetical protein